MALQVFGTPAPRRKSLSTHLGEAALGFADTVLRNKKESAEKNIEEEKKEEFRQAMLNEGMIIPKGASEKERIAIINQTLAAKHKEALQAKKEEQAKEILRGMGFGAENQRQRFPEPRRPQAFSSQTPIEEGAESTGMPGLENEPSKPQERRSAADIPDYEIAQLQLAEPGLANMIQRMKDTAIRERQEEEKAERRREENENKIEREEKRDLREFHMKYSKPEVERVDKMEQDLARKEFALDLGREAIESGNIGGFSKDFLADKYNLPFLKSSKGAQLTLAAKEQLFPNLNRISAKAQNQYMEQRMASMVPLLGQSDESNMTVQTILEGEADLDKAYIDEFRKLQDLDNASPLGVEKKDIKQRAIRNVQVKNKEIMRRTAYRLREIEEKEKGLDKVKSKVGKNVPKGTPATLGMGRLYIEKYGKENAVKMLKKNGYDIPSDDEFDLFLMTPKEYRETL